MSFVITLLVSVGGRGAAEEPMYSSFSFLITESTSIYFSKGYYKTVNDDNTASLVYKDVSHFTYDGVHFEVLETPEEIIAIIEAAKKQSFKIFCAHK